MTNAESNPNINIRISVDLLKSALNIDENEIPWSYARVCGRLEEVTRGGKYWNTSQ